MTAVSVGAKRSISAQLASRDAGAPEAGAPRFLLSLLHHRQQCQHLHRLAEGHVVGGGAQARLESRCSHRTPTC
jgi:hypothetical protein